MPFCSANGYSNCSVRNVELSFFFPVETTGSIEAKDSQVNGGYLCSLGTHLENNIKMITYDDQTSQGVSITPVLRVCTYNVIQTIINA